MSLILRTRRRQESAYLIEIEVVDFEFSNEVTLLDRHGVARFEYPLEIPTDADDKKQMTQAQYEDQILEEAKRSVLSALAQAEARKTDGKKLKGEGGPL